LVVNNQLMVSHIKEGIALFNSFTGNTHFLSKPISSVFEVLSESSCSKQELLNLYNQNNNFSETITAEQFNQFITEAVNSGIILE